MTTVFAHRGAHDVARENTLEAFVAARELGVHGVELDVRRTHDGQLVVHHDPAIGDLVIAQCAKSDLPAYVPRLDEALDVLRGLVVNVEIKNSRGANEPVYDESGSLVAQVLDVLHDLDAHATSIVSCFDVATCVRVRDYDREIQVAWLLWAAEVPPALTQAHVLGLNAVNPYYLSVREGDVANATALGLDLNVWTVNHDHDLVGMFDLGVASVITDEPRRALELLASRSSRPVLPGNGVD